MNTLTDQISRAGAGNLDLVSELGKNFKYLLFLEGKMSI